MKTLLMSAATALALTTVPALAEFPEKDLQGIIQWGAGGSTDVVMRAVTPHAEDVLGASVVMTNKTGGVGAIATKYVMTQKADGYTLLMGAENPQLYKVMGLGDIDYSDFIADRHPRPRHAAAGGQARRALQHLQGIRRVRRGASRRGQDRLDRPRRPALGGHRDDVEPGRAAGHGGAL